MRCLEITDTETARERAIGTDVPGWTLRRLQEAGFDLATEIVYHYTPQARTTVFLQYLSNVSGQGEICDN